MTLNITNDNKPLPYLAQAWVENEKNQLTEDLNNVKDINQSIL